MSTTPRAVLGWSSGKDCTLALHEARRQGLADVVALLTTTNESAGRVAMHGTRNALLRLQARALGLQLIEVPLPWPCSNDEYEARMGRAMAQVAALDVRHMVFGDLFLEDVRSYREAQLARAGMQGIFPLWGRDTVVLAQDIIDAGIDARIVTLDPTRLDPALAGRRYDRALLAELPQSVDPCGENGEFHTAVVDGPGFAAAIPVTTGQTVTRDGFVYADLIPL